jgi:tRNA threonylcarbamoyladenosine biosynthesis protein TsaB
VEIHAVVDAQRQELFCARFEARPLASGAVLPQLERLCPDAIVSADQWLASLTSGAVVSGSGLSRLQGRLPADTTATPQSQWEPRAVTVGRLAWRDYQSGRRDDLWKLAPVYLRPSYAEEKATSPSQSAWRPHSS